MVLPRKGGVKVVSLIGALFRAQEVQADKLPDHLFQRLAVALVHRQKEKRKHGEHHHQSGGAGAQAAPEEKEQRNADERAAAEADQLSLRQVESDLRFNFCQVLGDRNIGHKITLSIGQWALNTDFAMLLDLRSVKHISTV